MVLFTDGYETVNCYLRELKFWIQDPYNLLHWILAFLEIQGDPQIRGFLWMAIKRSVLIRESSNFRSRILTTFYIGFWQFRKYKVIHKQSYFLRSLSLIKQYWFFGTPLFIGIPECVCGYGQGVYRSFGPSAEGRSFLAFGFSFGRRRFCLKPSA